MSGISRLTTLGAAGAGGGGGFIISRSYATNANYGGYGVACSDSQGNIIAVGLDATNWDWIVFKTDSEGTEIWTKSISVGSGSTAPWLKRLHDVTVDSSDNIIIVGQEDTDGNLSGDRGETYIIKLNSSGVQQWAYNHSHGGFGSWYVGVVTDSSDNVYVAGTFSDYQNSYEYSGYVRKYNSSGTTQWRYRVYDSGDYLYLSGIAIDSSNNIILSGHVQDANQSNYYRPMLQKISSSGANLFDRRYDYSSNFHVLGYGVVLDSNNDIYINGQTTDGYDAIAMKFDMVSEGDIDWQKSLDGDGRNFGYGSDGRPSNMAIDSSDNIYFVQTAGSDQVIVSYDSSGNLRWATAMGSTDAALTHQLFQCKMTSDDKLLIGGRTASSTAADRRIITVVMPADGVADGNYGDYSFTSLTTTPANTTYTKQASVNIVVGTNGNNNDSTPTATVSSQSLTADNITNL